MVSTAVRARPSFAAGVVSGRGLAALPFLVVVGVVLVAVSFRGVGGLTGGFVRSRGSAGARLGGRGGWVPRIPIGNLAFLVFVDGGKADGRLLKGVQIVEVDLVGLDVLLKPAGESVQKVVLQHEVGNGG